MKRSASSGGVGALVRVIRGLAAVLLLATLAGAAGPATSAPMEQIYDDEPVSSAAASSVRMNAWAGYDGAGRVGGWLPLEVELTNQGSEVRAEVQVVIQQSGGRSTYTNVPNVFTLPVVLPRLSHKRYTMEVNLPSAGSRLTARLVRVPEGETLAERDVIMSRVALGDYFCGVLARDPSAYDFLAALDLPPPIRRVRTAYLEPSSIPDTATLFGSFDCLILDNAATGQLRQEQLDALQVWVGTGGLLIAVGGPTWQSTLGPLPPNLLPVQPTGLTSVNSLSGLGDFMGTTMDQPGPWLVTQSRALTERGAKVTIAQDSTPLVVAAKRGEGTVIFLAFEPTSRGMRSWDGNDQLWRFLVTHAAVDNGVGSALVRPYLRWGRVPRIGMADFSGHPKPSLDWLWWLLAGYSVTTGGTLFFLGRRGLVGGSVIALVTLTATAGVVALLLARDRAEPETAVTRLTVVRPTEVGESASAYTREYVSILAKRDGEYTYKLPPDSLVRGVYYPFPRPTDESDAGWRFRVSEGADLFLDKLALRQGQLATAVIDGQLRQAPGVQADLRVEYGQLLGSLVNRTGSRLVDAQVVVDNLFQPLGTVDAEQRRSIEITLPRQAAAGNLAATAIADNLTKNASTANGPGAAARRDLLESLFSARFLFQRMELRGPTLVGWLNQPPTAIETLGFRASNSSLTLLVQPLQPQLPRGFEGEVPAAAMNRRDLGIGSGTPTDRDYYTVAPGEAITLQFAIPPSDGSFQLRQLRLNVEGTLQQRGRPTGPQPFTVALFNWRAAEWQGWDVMAGTSIVPDGDRYVSAAGEIRLRYSLDAGTGATLREAQLRRLDITPIGNVR